ncbi:putative molibdopterin-dependent oxidoreductase YjgC [Evansella vedderi]|uniref:Molibdopterin-dependent oxidoreductase YjgC n=1 Tax=Evansella vedderi TaxID=38282 RepID=A0ABT9ZWG6_9BACI|nr:putative molibdopterin-dependent oxidoreductase YjgC [Evansella vedderi]
MPTTWEKALTYVAEKLTAIKETYGPDTVSVFACARATNETNFVTQRFARAVLGTNNIDGCNRT